MCLCLTLACLLTLCACGKKPAETDPLDTTAATNTPINPTTGTTPDKNTVPTTPAATLPDDPTNPSQPTTPPATPPATQPTTPPVQEPADSIHWDDDGVLKILTIGNSFSVDCMEYVYQIAKAAGVKDIRLGNLYIGGCTLETHLEKAKSDGRSYTYYVNTSGEWSKTTSYKMSAAVTSEDWDFVSFQQGSPVSGVADSYDDLNALMAIVEPLCTNKNVEFIWHMTWAYQGDSTHSGFATYNKDQMTMYNAIVSAVQSKIVPNQKIKTIVPNGTVIQNARTSYLGDSLTRDGYHMSYDQGRKLTGLAMVDALVGIDWSKIDLSAIITDEAFLKVAKESVQNALKTPFKVTPSTFKDLTGTIDFSKYTLQNLTFHKNQYYQSVKGTTLTGQKGTMEKYFATDKFTKQTLPVGSIIVIADGWKYRPEAWKDDALNASSKRPAEVSTQIVVVTEQWWADWTSRGFNIAKKDGSVLTSYTPEQISEVFKIYIPKS